MNSEENVHLVSLHTQTPWRSLKRKSLAQLTDLTMSLSKPSCPQIFDLGEEGEQQPLCYGIDFHPRAWALPT